MGAARAELESLLRIRRLDATLTTATPWRPEDADRLAPTGWGALDASLGGGLRRGQLSEIVGARSSGRTTVFCRLAAAATARGEVVALVDTHDRFDPASAAAAGLDLGRLLWIRDTGQADRALKAMNLVLQAGGFGIVAFDLAETSRAALQQFPHPTWMRLARVIEGSTTVALLIGSAHVARSPGGVTIALDPPSAAHAGTWQGSHVRARRLAGLPIRSRVISAHTGLSCVSPRTTS
jgi:hypothetical protein